MKKIIFLLIVVFLAGSLFAQNRGGLQRELNPITIEGTLKLERGVVAVESGDTVYLVPLLTRYISFINELREGEMISVEGYGFRNIVHPTKITIEGKSYDFPSLSRIQGLRNQFEHRRENERPNVRPDGRPERPERNNPGRKGGPA